MPSSILEGVGCTGSRNDGQQYKTVKSLEIKAKNYIGNFVVEIQILPSFCSFFKKLFQVRLVLRGGE
jgi:hypothetical protein